MARSPGHRHYWWVGRLIMMVLVSHVPRYPHLTLDSRLQSRSSARLVNIEIAEEVGNEEPARVSAFVS